MNLPGLITRFTYLPSTVASKHLYSAQAQLWIRKWDVSDIPTWPEIGLYSVEAMWAL